MIGAAIKPKVSTVHLLYGQVTFLRPCVYIFLIYPVLPNSHRKEGKATNQDNYHGKQILPCSQLSCHVEPATQFRNSTSQQSFVPQALGRIDNPISQSAAMLTTPITLHQPVANAQEVLCARRTPHPRPSVNESEVHLAHPQQSPRRSLALHMYGYTTNQAQSSQGEKLRVAARGWPRDPSKVAAPFPFGRG